MKKQFNKEKKLSLNKVQLMKINEMKTITGGVDIRTGFNLDGNDDPVTKPRTQGGGL